MPRDAQQDYSSVLIAAAEFLENAGWHETDNGRWTKPDMPSAYQGLRFEPLQAVGIQRLWDNAPEEKYQRALELAGLQTAQ